MALALIKDINPSVCLALWHIEEPLEVMAEHYPFTKGDRQILDGYKVQSKKAEWLAARLALRALLENRGLEQKPIHKDQFGKPHLHDSRAHISISHSKDWGAAALGLDAPIGIDIEYPRVQIQRIARKFLHAEESNWAGDKVNVLTQIWCAKEALYKLHGRTQLTFAEQLLVNPPDGDFPIAAKIRENGTDQDYHLQYMSIEEMCICVAY